MAILVMAVMNRLHCYSVILFVFVASNLDFIDPRFLEAFLVDQRSKFAECG
jgi:hypothetical protein